MNRVNCLSEFQKGEQPVILILGVFDGMHLGHKKLIDKALEIKENKGGEIVICTFSSNIGKICNEKTEKTIYTLDERLEMFEDVGVDCAIVCEFTEEFKNTLAQDFIQQIKDDVDPRDVIVGFDYRFGKEAKGNTALLKDSFENVQIVEEISVNGTKVSSSLLKKFIETADFRSFARFSGQVYGVSGTVIKGRQDGKKHGRPTANIDIPCGKILPTDGVYAVMVKVDQEHYSGVANLGTAPTFTDEHPKLEVYILDFDQDIYGKKIDIYFYQFLRKTVKYDSTAELYQQVDKDIEKTETFFT